MTGLLAAELLDSKSSSLELCAALKSPLEVARRLAVKAPAAAWTYSPASRQTGEIRLTTARTAFNKGGRLNETGSRATLGNPLVGLT